MKRFAALIFVLFLAACSQSPATVPYAGTWRMAYIVSGPDGHTTATLYAIAEIDRPHSFAGLEGAEGLYYICRGERYTQCDAQPAGRIEVGVFQRSLVVFAYHGDDIILYGQDADGQLDPTRGIEGGGRYSGNPPSEGRFAFFRVNTGLN